MVIICDLLGPALVILRKRTRRTLYEGVHGDADISQWASLCLAENKDQLPDVSTGQFISRDLLPPSQEVRQTMALAWRVKSVLPLQHHVVLLLLCLPHLSLQSPDVSARFPPPACLPTCFTAPSPLRGLFGLSQPDGKRHTPRIGKQATVSFIGAFVVKQERYKKKKRRENYFLVWRGRYHVRACAHTHTRTLHHSSPCCLPLTPESFSLTQVMD